MNSHQNLTVWKLARGLVGVIYKLTRALPADERFVVTPQLRRAAWSVQNNIAEGNAKRGRSERRRFFDSALAGLAEVDSMVTTLPDIYRVDPGQVQTVEELRRQITAGLFAMVRRGRR